MASQSDKLRILEICFSNGKGGLELYMANIGQYLAERGHQVWYGAKADSFLYEKLSTREVSLFPMTPKRRYLDFKIANKIAATIRENKIDIIHAHQSADLSTLILSRNKAGRGKLVFTQQMESSRTKKDLFHRWVYGNLDALIAITDRIKNQAEKNTPLPPQKIHRLYYGIDLKRFKPDPRQRDSSRKKFGISSEEVAIGMVGRLEEGKGQHILLQGMGRLQEQLPRVKVLLIGSETVGQRGYESRLKRLAEELGIGQRVIFTGFQEDVPAVSAALDITVLATKKETFGLSLIETMAQEIAPIGTAAGGVPEIIEDDMNGLLVPSFDIDALANALQKLINDPALRKRLGVRARKTVQEKFNLENHLAGLEKIFFDVINR
ncbi:MAG: glycosyltransferase family 4 protein [Calditrichia bacterium]